MTSGVHVGIKVVARAEGGGPLTMSEVGERLTEVGIDEVDDDRETAREELSPPAEWTWAENTCNYVAKMIDAWTTDTPGGSGRNPWLCSQEVRLACAHRLGCVTADDYRRGRDALERRHRELLATTEPRRKPKRLEFSDAHRLGLRRASEKTDDQCRAELGDHEHNPVNEEPPAEEAKPPAEIHRGQARFAYLLVDDEAGRLLHVYGIGWHYWDGKRWRRDDKGRARRAVLALNRRLWGDAIGDKDLQADCRKCDTATGINGVLEISSVLEPFAANVGDLDADPFLLNVANGTLDLHTLKLRPFSTDDRITKLCNGAHDPDAATPVWDGFLAKVLPDEDVREFVQRLAGLALLGEVREHILPIFTGIGGNGKGTLYEALLYALGDYAATGDPELFMHRENAHPTGEMDLLGKRLVVVSENDQGRRLAEATMKRLTGGDRIKARHMRKDFVEFTPSHLAVLVTNHLPKVSGDDPAIWRRIRVVPFNVVIPEADYDTELGAKLRLEADGILTWAVNGLRDYLDHGLAAPESVRVATDEYRTSSDSVARFLGEACYPAGRVSAGDLFDAWDKWRKIDGSDEISKTALGKTLGRLGYESSDSNGKRWWHGICILDEEEQ